MDKIPLNVFKERVKKAQELMIKAGVQAMQITSRENYYYFSGDVRNVARILIPQDSEPIIIVFEGRNLQMKIHGLRILKLEFTPRTNGNIFRCPPRFKFKG